MDIITQVTYETLKDGNTTTLEQIRDKAVQVLTIGGRSKDQIHTSIKTLSKAKRWTVDVATTLSELSNVPAPSQQVSEAIFFLLVGELKSSGRTRPLGFNQTLMNMIMTSHNVHESWKVGLILFDQENV